MSTPSDNVRPARLECGRDALDTVDRARAGRSDAHMLGCPFCQAAVAAAGLTGDAASDLAAADAEITVPPTLLPNVMRGVWAELRRTTDIPLDTPTGTTFVTDRAVVAMVQARLDESTDLIIHTCHVDFAGGPGRLAIRASAAGPYGSDLPDVARRARTAVVEELWTQFGLRAEPVDIDIVDVYLPERTP